MADDLRIALVDVLRKAELEHDLDFLREGVRVLTQALMELKLASMSAPNAVRAPLPAPDSATAIASAVGTPAPVPSNCACRACATTAIFPL